MKENFGTQKNSDGNEAYILWQVAVRKVSAAWIKKFGSWMNEKKPWCDPVEEDRLARRVARAIKMGDIQKTEKRIEDWKNHWRKLWREYS
jgi:hypothetical protein